MIAVGTVITAVLWTVSAKIMSQFIHAIETKNIHFAELMFKLFGLLIVVSYVIKFTKKIINWYFSSSISIFMDSVYIKKFLLLDNNYVERIWTGKFNSIVRKGVSAWIWIVSSLISSGVYAVITIIMAFVLIGMNNPRWTNLVILWVFILFAKIWFDGYREIWIFRKIRRDVYIRQDRRFIKIFMTKFEILQDQKNQQEVDQYKSHLGVLKKSYVDGSKKEFLHIDTANILIDIARLTLLFFTWWGVMWDAMSISLLVLYTYLLNMVISALASINGLTSSLTEQFVYVEKLRDTFDKWNPILHYKKWLPYIHKKWEIKFEKLMYSVGSHVIFKDFNLEIKWGKTTALVWTSGSWKSTLAKFMAGYLHPDAGKVLVDWQDLEVLKLTSFYDHLWYLTQDPSIFDGTVRENLLYATKWDVSQEKIDQVVKDAQCEFIYEFPDWLETQVGEKWSLLSGGQRQRLAIAKILIKDPDIIVLDEPTSALDSFSERKVTDIMNEVFKNKTVIVIAHRLQTVIEADEIVVLERSFGDDNTQQAAHIAQRWTHTELVEQDWIYAYMFALQSGQM